MKQLEQLESYLKNNQKTWLITGVAGFIGSNLLERLLILNQKVVGLDNYESGYHENISQAIEDAKKASGNDYRDNFRFVNGDVRKLNNCFEACEGVDYVLHQAAIGSVPRSIEDPINTNSTNVDGFLNMLIASKEKKVKRFVYASSSAVYGDHPVLPKVEENIGNPLSPYAATKFFNEIYARVFAENYNFKTIGLRYFNIFGKRQDPNGAYAAVIPKWISNIINDEKVYINGDGETSRDFCYIENAIQINLIAATINNENALNQVYNVALNERTSLNQLYEIIHDKILGKTNGLKNKKPIYKDFRPGDVKHSLANIDKAKKLLNYNPQIKILEGLDKVIKWYLQ